MGRLTLDEKGNATGTAGTLTDITERKRAEEEKIQKEKLLSTLEMAGAICHELHQPMQAILNLSELLLLNIPENDPVYGKLDAMQKQIHRMNEITNKLATIHDYKTISYIGSSRIVDIHGNSGRND